MCTGERRYNRGEMGERNEEFRREKFKEELSDCM
jgi:hypothetical protein